MWLILFDVFELSVSVGWAEGTRQEDDSLFG